jgi:hypothetical protein
MARSTGASPTSGGGGGGSGPPITDGSVTMTATAASVTAASFATFAHLTRRRRMPIRIPWGSGSPPEMGPPLK